MYHKDGEFRDPVVRCDSCSKIIRTAQLKSLGSCVCGNRKVRNLLVFDDDELKQMQEWGIDPEFLRLFEVHQDVA